MLLTATPTPTPYGQAFDAIKAAVDSMPVGVKLFINSGMVIYRLLKSVAHYT